MRDTHCQILHVCKSEVDDLWTKRTSAQKKADVAEYEMDGGKARLQQLQSSL